jgi:histidine ammonia-lyase
MIRTRREITLELIHAVAWRGAGLEIAPEALALMDQRQQSFETLVSERVRQDPQALIYGVTSAPGDAVASALTEEAEAGRRSVKPLHMAADGWAEEARTIASPTLLSLGGFGQNDVPVLNFLAWRKASAIGKCLDAVLAVLAALASQALLVAEREPPPNLRSLVAQVRAAFPPVTEPRALGEDCQRLADSFTRRVFE